jgi:cytochrome c oxidase subunit 4
MDLSLSPVLFDHLRKDNPQMKMREGEEGSMENRGAKSHLLKYGTYVFVWVGLVILTAITASVAGFRLGGWAILISLAIAGTKSGLVLNYFMHLKSERLLIFKVIIPLVMAVFLVFILLTFSDLAFRGGVK